MKTLVWPVEFRRWCYWHREKKDWVYLLEEALGRGVLCSRYADLEDTWVVINGDAAESIRAGAGRFKQAIYQYDRFHLWWDLNGYCVARRGALRRRKRPWNGTTWPSS